MYFEKHHLFLKPFYQLVMFVDFRFLHFLYKFGIFRERGAFSIFFFPSIFVFVTKIRYSTSKMTPLTISLLQLISTLSGISISTIPDHWGPHQSPKTATHTPKKHHFPQASLFSWLTSGTPPQIWPHQPNLCLNLSQIYLELAYLPFPTIRGPIRAPKRQHKHPKTTVSSASLFSWLITGTPPQKWPH